MYKESYYFSNQFGKQSLLKNCSSSDCTLLGWKVRRLLPVLETTLSSISPGNEQSSGSYPSQLPFGCPRGPSVTSNSTAIRHKFAYLVSLDMVGPCLVVSLVCPGLFPHTTSGGVVPAHLWGDWPATQPELVS